MSWYDEGPISSGQAYSANPTQEVVGGNAIIEEGVV